MAGKYGKRKKPENVKRHVIPLFKGNFKPIFVVRRIFIDRHGGRGGKGELWSRGGGKTHSKMVL